MRMPQKIDTGYKPHRFQYEIHRKLKRFSVIVCHRRFGKTVLAVNQLIDRALKAKPKAAAGIGFDTELAGAPRFGYVAPELKQAKAIAWEMLKSFTANIPHIRKNESELWIELPHNKARIQIFGADNADALRGLYFDGIILDEIGDFKRGVWGQIIRPALADREGWAIFIGTPKGINEFYELFVKAQKTDGWVALIYPVTKTKGKLPNLSAGEMEKLRDELTENEWRQEFLCDFTASTTNTVITIDAVLAANAIKLRNDQFKFAPMVIGVDVARFGDDRTVLQPRQGLATFEPTIINGYDTNEVVGEVVNMINLYNPDAVFIDGGGGQGVIDNLHRLGYRDIVIEVQFGSKALNPKKYVNKRAGMWFGIAEWLKSGGALPNCVELDTSLVAPTYKYDMQGRKQLEKKENIKDRTGSSPDPADALALTFAFPVQKKERRREPQRRKGEESYDPWDD